MLRRQGGPIVAAALRRLPIMPALQKTGKGDAKTGTVSPATFFGRQCRHQLYC